MTSEILTGEEETVNGDSGYLGAEKRQDAIIRNKNGKKIKYIINRRPSSIKKLSTSGQCEAKKTERKNHRFVLKSSIFSEWLKDN